MKFNINRDHFSNGLAQVLNLVGSKAILPILGNVMIEADGDHITLSTTNLDLAIRCGIKADVKVDGAVTLPVKRLATIVRELPNLDVSISADSKHQVKLSSGSSNFRIMGTGTAEFPDRNTHDFDRTITFRQEELTSMLRSVAYAQSTDELRYILNGVNCHFENNQLSLAATDGRRLALASRPVVMPEDVAIEIILPAKTVYELLRMLDKGENLKVSFSESQVAFEIDTDKDVSGLVDSIFLYSKVVSGSYPNYEQVIPKETKHLIKLDRERLLECVSRVALVCSEKFNAVKLNLSSNSLNISAHSPEYGEANESMAINYTGEDFFVCFSAEFVIDPLKALDMTEIVLELDNENTPGVFKTADRERFSCVIMPVRDQARPKF